MAAKQRNRGGPYRRHVEKTVKPRKPYDPYLPIIAWSREGILVERSGRIYPPNQLKQLIASEPSSIFLCHNAPLIVKGLDNLFRGNERWQFKASPIEREVWQPNRDAVRTYKETVIGFFGFMGEQTVSQTGKVRTKPGTSRYFYPLDPIRFIRKSIFDIRPGAEKRTLIDPTTGEYYEELEKLYEWGIEVRQWCSDNELRISPTSGGIATQLLRDKRFYPEARRKVPKATNANVRAQLPGNFYRLYNEREGNLHNATYLDQTNAHHSAAKDLEFPSANSIFARGNYLSLKKDIPRAWLNRGTSQFENFREKHRGLIYARIHVPHMAKISFHLPMMDKPGFHKAFLFSNEWDYLESFRGAYVDCIYAAWSSPDIDRGLNRYAGWAIKQILESDPYRRNWLKPVLLATYGILASKPKQLEVGYHQAKKGEVKFYPVGGERLEVLATRMNKEAELAIVNVIHRGMVEAETRIRSLKLARWLTDEYKAKVLAVYADSVFIDSTTPIPFLPEPWKVQAELTALRFYTATSFVSNELSKLPGIPKEKRAMIAQARSALAARPTQEA